MATTHTLVTRSRASEDDLHDQIGSNSSTPPGAATPRPDLTDKRLPGIIHSYFGQVRDSFRASAEPANDLSSPPNSIPTTHGESKGTDAEMRPQNGGDPLPTAPSSPGEAQRDAQELPPLLPHERLDLPPQLPGPQPEPSAPYPTPPASSSSSIHRASKGESGGPSPSGERPSAARTLSSQDEKNGSAVLPLRVRRHTFASPSPLSAVVAAHSVPAAHLSNPASPSLSPSENPTHAIIAQLSASRRQSSSSLSRRGSRKLTKGGSTPPGNQSTPPHTPRTRSQDGPIPISSASTPSALSRTQGQGPTAPVLGKLTVEISEGRGLRPSFDPYVVCQFQWSEYISQGPINADVGGKPATGPGQPNGMGGIAMRRTDSEKSRPRAIPMSSRQSSHTGKDSREMRSSMHEVTDPKWEHKAVL